MLLFPGILDKSYSTSKTSPQSKWICVEIKQIRFSLPTGWKSQGKAKDTFPGGSSNTLKHVKLSCTLPTRTLLLFISFLPPVHTEKATGPLKDAGSHL